MKTNKGLQRSYVFLVSKLFITNIKKAIYMYMKNYNKIYFKLKMV